MFASAGLLRDIPCPFFAAGSCDRPHCVLSHGTQSPSSNTEPVTLTYEYAPKRGSADEYDPAANFETSLLRRLSPPTDYAPEPQIVTSSYASNNDVSNQNKPTKPAHSVSTANTSAKPAASAVNAPKQPPPAPKPVQYSDMAKEKRGIGVITAKSKVTETSKTTVSSPTAQPTQSSKRVLDKTAAISASQILDTVVPKKLSPVLDEFEAASSSQVDAKRKKVQAAPSNSSQPKLEKSVIDLTDEPEPSTKPKPSAPSSSLMEAAALRVKRKLMSPADVCMARMLESEAANGKPSITSPAQSFRPHNAPEGARVAHAPRVVSNTNTKVRPRIPVEFNARVPTSIRQNLLDKLVTELLKYEDQSVAYEKALQLEKDAYTRSSNDKVYRQVMPNVMAKLRRELGTSTGTSPTKNVATVSHTAMLLPAGAHKVGVGIAQTKSPPTKDSAGSTSLSKSQLFQLLSKYFLTEDKLKNNGYPVMDSSKVVSIKPPDKRVTQRQSELSEAALAAGERDCARCGKRFRINPATGAFIKREECQYHSGRVIKTRTHARHIEQVYSCCQAVAGSTTVGCQLGSTHVHELNRMTDLEGYVCTPDDKSNSPGIFAIDCEMVYTLKGVELARVTVIDYALKQVYDALVRPETDVLDYNTEFSGLKKCDFDNVTDRLADIQRKLCSFINSRSILVGHSLESDLIALKLIHRRIVDTAVVFPHPQGPPFKRALRTLVSEYLRKAIQQGVGGHDSFEDAASAMELMLFKVKSDHASATGGSTSAVADRSNSRRNSSTMFNSPQPK